MDKDYFNKLLAAAGLSALALSNSVEANDFVIHEEELASIKASSHSLSSSIFLEIEEETSLQSGINVGCAISGCSINH